MLKVHLHDRDGNKIADIETLDGVVPRTGETVRIVVDGDAGGDYRVEFVRWNLGEDGQTVQVMMERLEKQDLWPEGAPEAGQDNVIHLKR